MPDTFQAPAKWADGKTFTYGNIDTVTEQGETVLSAITEILMDGNS